MQSLQTATNSPPTSRACAADVLDAVLAVMRLIRQEMRQNRTPGLSVPQFRALLFVNHSQRASLSALAEHLGLSLPATSRMVHGLVEKGLLARQGAPGDRRQIALSLTARGQEAYQAARQATQKRLARLLAPLPAPERAQIRAGMALLQQQLAIDDSPSPAEGKS